MHGQLGMFLGPPASEASGDPFQRAATPRFAIAAIDTNAAIFIRIFDDDESRMASRTGLLSARQFDDHASLLPFSKYRRVSLLVQAGTAPVRRP
jgi:hypothetical protein